MAKLLRIFLRESSVRTNVRVVTTRQEHVNRFSSMLRIGVCLGFHSLYYSILLINLCLLIFYIVRIKFRFCCWIKFYPIFTSCSKQLFNILFLMSLYVKYNIEFFIKNAVSCIIFMIIKNNSKITENIHEVAFQLANS